MTWDTSCLDWERRLLAGESLVPDLPLFKDQADKAERIFKRLRVPDVIGTPTLGEIGGPWLFPIVRAIFGAYDSEAARRMISEIFLLIAKKNSKSSSAAAIMLTGAIINERPDADLTLIAPTKEVADISFKQASGTIRLDSELDKIFHIQRNLRLITHRNTDARLQIKAADTEVITGVKSLFTLLDESHVFGTKSRAGEIYTEIRGALASRPDGFFMQITTQSKDPPSGVFKTELQAARDVRDGVIKAPLLPILYEYPSAITKSGEWKKKAFWHLVNPNLGRSVDEAFLERELAKAERTGMAALALFASQHFNVEIGIGLRTDCWVGAEFWEISEDKEITFEYMLENCEVIVVGIDGGGMDDLLGAGFVGRHRETKKWLVWTRSWCHKIVFERRKSIAAVLSDFVESKDLIVVDDLLKSMSDIVDLIQKVNEKGLLAEVAADSMGPFGSFVEALSLIGITQESDGAKLIGVAQGIAMMGAIKTSENKLANGTMKHSKDACMSWCVSNIKIEPTATAIRATKANAGDAKIDTAMAVFDGVSRMVLNPEAPGYSVYEERGLRIA